MIFSFSEYLLLHQWRLTSISYDVSGEIQNLLQITWRYIENQTHTAWNTLEIPNVRNRGSKFNVTHSLTSHF